MKFNTMFLAVSALALVAGCSRGGTANNAAAANAAAANAAAPAAEPVGEPDAAAGNVAAAGEAGGTVDRAFMIGRWGMAGNCTGEQVIEFKEDGTANPGGGAWTIEGNVVTMTSPEGQPDPGTVTRTGDDSMTVVGGGRTTAFTRCE